MSAPRIIPVILAGGKGTRLWPVSRQDLPKQFCEMADGRSLFQQSIMRVQNNPQFAAPIIVTGESYLELAISQLRQISCEPHAIICEPAGRDTAAAVLLAAEIAISSDDKLLLVMPSDHLIGNEEPFMQAIADSVTCAADNQMIVTFGIKPTHPETGFGYLRSGRQLANSAVCDLDGFIEKPSLAEAERLLTQSNVFWNAGIFLFHGDTVREEFAIHAPDIFDTTIESVSHGHWDGRVFRPHTETFLKIPSNSFDYAIMEPTTRKATMAVDPDWSDLGSWKAIWETSERDQNDSFVGKNCYAVNSKDSYLRSDGPVIGVAGVDDIVVVASPDAILVTSRENPQDVKGLVDQLISHRVEAATAHINSQSEWGQISQIDNGFTHNVKRITLNAGSGMAARYHHNHARSWTVISGEIGIAVDGVFHHRTTGEQVHIPAGKPYQVENLGADAASIIEVRTGDYFGEDDVVLLDHQIDADRLAIRNISRAA